MRRTLSLLAGMFCSGVCAAAAPPDSIYMCVDADGHKTYQNSSDGNACHRIDGVIASIPATDIGRGMRPRPSLSNISPASFPRVDVGTQRVRDSDRRRLLQEELRTEEERLNGLRSDLRRGSAGADAPAGSSADREQVQRLAEEIERTEGNIASLRRELTPLRY